MKKMFYRLICLFVVASVSLAQDVTVSASVDSQSINIGDWIRYSVEISHPSAVQVVVPSFKDTLGAFDIVQQDSLIRTESGGVVQLHKKFVITKFDAGRHDIAPFTVQYNDGSKKIKKAQSNAIPIEVRSIEIDTSATIRDVKPPLSLPVTAEEIALYAAIALAIAAAGYGIYYYMKRRQKNIVVDEEEKPNIPPHVLALLQLDELQTKELWQKGEVKEFYSESSEIVRRYFELRYGITALEMTTGEVMDQLKKFAISKEIFHQMERFLSDADLVKFAKHHPTALENETIIPTARKIVEDTKPVEVAEQPEEKIDGDTSRREEAASHV